MTDPFHPLSVRDIPLLTRYFARQDTRLCNASAGAAVLWQPYFQDAALEVDGTLLLREQFPGLGMVFSTPIGENVGNAYDFLVKYCRAVGQPVQFFPATAADVENLRARFGDVEVTPVRDWFDYLYDAQDMVTFRGRRFNGQRNHIHHFQRLYPDWAFERVTEENLPEVCAFFDDFTRRYHKDSDSAQAEEGCVREFLRDFAAYAPLAGLLRVNGRVAGFSAGEIGATRSSSTLKRRTLPTRASIRCWSTNMPSASSRPTCATSTARKTWATRGCGARRNRITPCACSKNIWYAFRYSRRKEKRSCRKSMNF